MKRYSSAIITYMILFASLMAFVFYTGLSSDEKPATEVHYTDITKLMEEGQVKSISIQQSDEINDYGKATVVLNDDTKHVVSIPGLSGFMTNIQNKAEEYGVVIKTMPPANTAWLRQMLPSLLMMVVAIFIIMYVFQHLQGGSKASSFGKSKAKAVTDTKVTLKDVAGLDEEKEELYELVDFLRNPKKYRDLGARIPKGILLVGPPGTGKTLLAKAVAGEAGVPFYTISGSDFVELYVGVGASRVRDLFETSKKNAPCLIFIDEIDAVGRRRGAGLGGGHDEREQTLNQLLVEMDGFSPNEGVIVLAATNRADILDPAILRPGRFDRQVAVGRPDVRGREEILRIHAKGKPLAKETSLAVIAKTTAGFTGADLENLLNESALLTARAGKKEIEMEEIQRALVKVAIGTEKKSRKVSNEEKRITAYHEAGHAILHEVLETQDPVHSVSIIPTGWAGGYTMHLPDEDKMFQSKKFMKETIVTLLGGRAAEMIVLNDITTGAANDIERATKMARSMVTKYGMSDKLGPLQFGDDNTEVFIGRDLAHTRNYGEEVASLIDKEIRRIVDKAYEIAKELLQDNLDVLHEAAAVLIEKEKITGDEFRAIIEKVNPSLPKIVKSEIVDEIKEELLEATETTEKKPDDSDKI